jgi:hypothetical protein
MKKKIVERLKPERVEQGLSVRKMIQRLKAMERLDGLPGWRLSPDSRAIARVRPFDAPEEAAAYAAFAIQLAAGRRQRLKIALSSCQLAITLSSRSGHGITGTLLDLAAELG